VLACCAMRRSPVSKICHKLLVRHTYYCWLACVTPPALGGQEASRCQSSIHRTKLDTFFDGVRSGGLPVLHRQHRWATAAVQHWRNARFCVQAVWDREIECSTLRCIACKTQPAQASIVALISCSFKMATWKKSSAADCISAT